MARNTIKTQSTQPEAEVEETPTISRRPINMAAQIASQTTEVQQSVESGKTVTVRIPRDFSLTLADFTQVHYKVGVDEMPIEHATHWYSVASGVEIYDSKKSRE